MNRDTLNVLLCSIITTLDETKEGWAPRSYVMLGCNLDLDSYQFVESVMVKGGLVETTSETITITPKGREIAKKVNDHIKAARGL